MPYSRYLELRREVFLMSTLDVEPHRHFFPFFYFHLFGVLQAYYGEARGASHNAPLPLGIIVYVGVFER